ncbi:PAS domain-containing sensor histidine kinase, partial [Kaarinaea lacus]
EGSGRDLALLMEAIRRDPAKYENNENENIKRNGERVWIAWKNKPIFSEAGKLIEIQSVGIDISARKQAEDALQQSEAKWRSITENSIDHIMLVNREGNISFINHTALGLAPEQLINTPMTDYLPPAYKQVANDCLQRVWNTGEPDQFTVEYEVGDGSVLYYESNVGPVKEGEKIVAVLVSARDISKRKHTEVALRNSEERMRLLVEQADAVLWSVDRQLKFTSSVGGGLRGLGLLPNQVVDSGLDLYQFFQTQSKDYAPIKAHLQALEGKSGSYEFDWQGRYYQSQIVPQFDEAGNITGCIGAAVDVTHRKQAEEALRIAHHELETRVAERTAELAQANVELKKQISERERTQHLLDESERKFQTIFESSNDAVMLLDSKGFLDCNDATLKMFGFISRNEFVGKHPSELSPANQANGEPSQELADKKITDAFASGKNFFEWTHQRKNGEAFPAEVLLTPMTIAGETILQATVRDITDRKRVEEQLNRQKTLFEAVFRDVPDTMLIADVNRKIMMCNPAFTRMFLYRSEEIVGQTKEILYESLEEFERLGRERFNLSAEEKVKPYVMNYKRKGGELFPGETVGAPIRDEDGFSIGFMVVIRDISERIQAEEEINRQKAELETSNKELESYSYSIAHDLRSPLRAITGFSQILMADAKDKLNAEDLDHLSRIIDAGKNLSNLIDDILELSRISRRELSIGTVNLSNVGNDIILRLQQSQPNKQVQWQAQENLIAKGDVRLLEVALQNLIENAWKYSRDKTPATIELGAAIVNKEKAYYVKDNGVGFDMAYKDKLFKPFHRLHSLQEFEGTGIGLATVHRIIQRHGGRVWVEAAENQGAAFYFTLSNSP